MGTTITVANRGDQNYNDACSSAAAASPTGDIEVAITTGVSGIDAINALEKVKQFIAKNMVEAEADP